MRATPIYSLSAELGANTIDPDKLNCRVRNGFVTSQLLLSRWNPARRLLSVSSHHFQRQITRKAQVLHLYSHL